MSSRGNLSRHLFLNSERAGDFIADPHQAVVSPGDKLHINRKTIAALRDPAGERSLHFFVGQSQD